MQATTIQLSEAARKHLDKDRQHNVVVTFMANGVVRTALCDIADLGGEVQESIRHVRATVEVTQSSRKIDW